MRYDKQLSIDQMCNNFKYFIAYRSTVNTVRQSSRTNNSLHPVNDSVYTCGSKMRLPIKTDTWQQQQLPGCLAEKLRCSLVIRFRPRQNSSLVRLNNLLPFVSHNHVNHSDLMCSTMRNRRPAGSSAAAGVNGTDECTVAVHGGVSGWSKSYGPEPEIYGGRIRDEFFFFSLSLLFHRATN